MNKQDGDTLKKTALPDRYDALWIERLDGRTRLAQSVRDRYAALTADLGGDDALSYQQRSLAKRALWIEASIESQEAALSRGEDVDAGRMTQQVNTLIGLYKTLGLKRQAREVSLTDYIKARS